MRGAVVQLQQISWIQFTVPVPVFSFMWTRRGSVICHCSIGQWVAVTLSHWPSDPLPVSICPPLYHVTCSPVWSLRLQTTRTSAILHSVIPTPSSAQHRVIPNLDPEYNSPHPAPIRPYTLHQDGQHRHPHPHRSFRRQSVHCYSQLQKVMVETGASSTKFSQCPEKALTK